MNGLLPPLTTSPVLETEAITGNFPHCAGGSGVSGQQEVLVEEVLLVAIELHSPTGHNKNCCLGLGSLLMNWLAIQHVDLKLTGWQHLKKITQRIQAGHNISIPN